MIPIINQVQNKTVQIVGGTTHTTTNKQTTLFTLPNILISPLEEDTYFLEVNNEKTRGYGYKLQQRKFQLKVLRKK